MDDDVAGIDRGLGIGVGIEIVGRDFDRRIGILHADRRPRTLFGMGRGTEAKRNGKCQQFAHHRLALFGYMIMCT